MPTEGQKALAAKQAAKAAMKAQPKLADKSVDNPVNLTEVSGSKKNKGKAGKVRATTSSKRGSTARY